MTAGGTTALPRLVYCEAIPDPFLQPFVTRIYEVRSTASPAEDGRGLVFGCEDPLVRRLLPNADANLIVDLGTPGTWRTAGVPNYSRGRAFVVGVMQEPRPVSFNAGVHLFGVAFAVARSLPLFAVMPTLLADRIVRLADVWGDEALSIDHHLRTLTSFEERAAWMCQALARRVSIRPRDDSELQAILAHVRSRRGAARVHALAADAGLSRQRFTRWFESSVGMGPKRFIRLARIHALLTRVLSSPVCSWTDVAGAFGYYDQAHMIAEFSWFTGLAPDAFLRARASRR
jgi:AraC-like DNA-binding protein